MHSLTAGDFEMSFMLELPTATEDAFDRDGFSETAELSMHVQASQPAPS
jgi:hypothetical protein